MFGFLYAPAPSCGSSVKSLYQSIFCGLSCKLHADYSAAARWLVNRDSTFLALAGSALAEEDPPMEERTCCNPLATRKPICCHEGSLSYAAAVTVSGLAVKLKDNADDERGWRSYLPKIAGDVISPARDKATAVLNSSGFPTQKVIQTLGRQTEIENSQAGFIEASEPTAQSYGSIFSHLAELNDRPKHASSLFRLGSSLGRLIYWKDALDDWKKDEQRDRFNPLRYQSPNELPALVNQEFTQLQSSTAEIPWQRHHNLIESIISHTTHHHQESMLAFGGARQKKRKKKKEGKNSWCDACDCCDCCSDCGCDSCGCDCG